MLGQDSNRSSDKDKKVIEEIKRLMDYELQLVLRQDTAGLRKFHPDDMVVTNPFNQFIDKKQVMERMKANIIKYTSYEKKIDFIHLEGDHTVVVIGWEIVVPAPDANQPKAGETINRRFTEIWMKRGKEWKKVIRHSNTIVE